MDTTLTLNKTLTAPTLLKWTYAIVPIVAGLDKFVYLLTNWDKYLSPVIADVLPVEAHSLMIMVGIIEVIAGLIVILKPKTGALIVSLWLFLIAINLFLTGEYLDIAVRDLVMAVGAYSLYLLLEK